MKKFEGAKLENMSFQLPSSNEVQVEMEDVLPSAPFHIKNKAVPGTIDRLALCDLLGSKKQFEGQSLILFGQLIDTADVFSWNN